ncbi:MAG TPA: sigma-54 dependent transcriptional regulator [Labilithrix sp.]|nr:sigma-54 dependent transcriptional regulator [Labilithrix sp.]
MTEPGAATNAEERASPRPVADSPVRVLVVDDEAGVRNAIARVLRNANMIPSTVDSGAAALELLAREPFDVALLDVRMPGMTGPQLLSRMKAARYPAEVIMMTAFADIATTVSAVKEGAYGFLTKPFVANESIVIEVLNAAGHKRLRERTERLQRELADLRPGEMVGLCPQMREVNRIISGVAKADSTILVLGESGTGKELVARAIHQRSRRASKPLVAVNCAAIPHELVESELFGHTRGAFTTAISARAGLFEAANGGSLFLDEIGDLPLSVQVKLLRTLESGEIKPVGSDTVRHVDVRVIAATNANLRALIAAGSFRQDLFYRLNVIAVHLPPLREREDDVLRLAQHFLQKFAEAAGRPTPRLTPDAAQCLQQYDWPGNVRELEHAIERALVLDESEVIHASSLPPEIVNRVPATPTSSGQIRAAAPSSPNLPASTFAHEMVSALSLHELAYADAKRRVLSDFTEAYVAALLRITGGNMSEAARRSGLDRSNFRRLVRPKPPSSDDE